MPRKKRGGSSGSSPEKPAQGAFPSQQYCPDGRSQGWAVVGDGDTNSRPSAHNLSESDQAFSNLQEMFKDKIEPEVIHMVLMECDWKAEDAVEKLFMMTSENEHHGGSGLISMQSISQHRIRTQSDNTMASGQNSSEPIPINYPNNSSNHCDGQPTSPSFIPVLSPKTPAGVNMELGDIFPVGQPQNDGDLQSAMEAFGAYANNPPTMCLPNYDPSKPAPGFVGIDASNQGFRASEIISNSLNSTPFQQSGMQLPFMMGQGDQFNVPSEIDPKPGINHAHNFESQYGYNPMSGFGLPQSDFQEQTNANNFAPASSSSQFQPSMFGNDVTASNQSQYSDSQDPSNNKMSNLPDLPVIMHPSGYLIRKGHRKKTLSLDPAEREALETLIEDVIITGVDEGVIDSDASSSSDDSDDIGSHSTAPRPKLAVSGQLSNMQNQNSPLEKKESKDGTCNGPFKDKKGKQEKGKDGGKVYPAQLKVAVKHMKSLPPRFLRRLQTAQKQLDGTSSKKTDPQTETAILEAISPGGCNEAYNLTGKIESPKEGLEMKDRGRSKEDHLKEKKKKIRNLLDDLDQYTDETTVVIEEKTDEEKGMRDSDKSPGLALSSPHGSDGVHSPEDLFKQMSITDNCGPNMPVAGASMLNCADLERELLQPGMVDVMDPSHKMSPMAQRMASLQASQQNIMPLSAMAKDTLATYYQPGQQSNAYMSVQDKPHSQFSVDAPEFVPKNIFAMNPVAVGQAPLSEVNSVPLQSMSQNLPAGITTEQLQLLQQQAFLQKTSSPFQSQIGRMSPQVATGMGRVSPQVAPASNTPGGQLPADQLGRNSPLPPPQFMVPRIGQTLSSAQVTVPPPSANSAAALGLMPGFPGVLPPSNAGTVTSNGRLPGGYAPPIALCAPMAPPPPFLPHQGYGIWGAQNDTAMPGSQEKLLPQLNQKLQHVNRHTVKDKRTGQHNSPNMGPKARVSQHQKVDSDAALMNYNNNAQTSSFNAVTAKARTEQLTAGGQKVMVILRGLPGSGKSSIAKEIQGSGVVLTADDFFLDGNGVYQYDQSKIPLAHEWNQKRAKEAVEQGRNPIVIDNTNTQSWEMKYYVSLARNNNYLVEVMEPDTPWKFNAKELARRNLHGVSLDVIVKMLDRYDRYVTPQSLLGTSLLTTAASRENQQFVKPATDTSNQQADSNQDQTEQKKPHRRRRRRRKKKKVAETEKQEAADGDEEEITEDEKPSSSRATTAPKSSAASPTISTENTVISSASSIAFTEIPTISSEGPPTSTAISLTSTESSIISSEFPTTTSDGPQISMENPVISTDSPQISMENPVISTDSPQISTESSSMVSRDNIKISAQKPEISIETPRLSSPKTPHLSTESTMVSREGTVVTSEIPKLSTERSIEPVGEARSDDTCAQNDPVKEQDTELKAGHITDTVSERVTGDTVDKTEPEAAYDHQPAQNDRQELSSRGGSGDLQYENIDPPEAAHPHIRTGEELDKPETTANDDDETKTNAFQEDCKTNDEAKEMTQSDNVSPRTEKAMDTAQDETSQKTEKSHSLTDTDSTEKTSSKSERLLTKNEADKRDDNGTDSVDSASKDLPVANQTAESTTTSVYCTSTNTSVTASICSTSMSSVVSSVVASTSVSTAVCGSICSSQVSTLPSVSSCTESAAQQHDDTQDIASFIYTKEWRKEQRRSRVPRKISVSIGHLKEALLQELAACESELQDHSDDTDSEPSAVTTEFDDLSSALQGSIAQQQQSSELSPTVTHNDTGQVSVKKLPETTKKQSDSTEKKASNNQQDKSGDRLKTAEQKALPQRTARRTKAKSEERKVESEAVDAWGPVDSDGWLTGSPTCSSPQSYVSYNDVEFEDNPTQSEQIKVETSAAIISPKQKRVKKQRHKDRTATILDDKVKVELLSSDWQVPDYPVTGPNTAASSATGSGVLLCSNAHTTTSPADFKILKKINEVGRTSNKTVQVRLAYPRLITADLETDEREASWSSCTKIMTDRSTSTEEMSSSDYSDKVEFLMSCFPSVAKTDLIHILEQCGGDSEWATNLLLDSGCMDNDILSDSTSVGTEAVMTESDHGSQCEEAAMLDRDVAINDSPQLSVLSDNNSDSNLNSSTPSLLSVDNLCQTSNSAESANIENQSKPITDKPSGSSLSNVDSRIQPCFQLQLSMEQAQQLIYSFGPVGFNVAPDLLSGEDLRLDVDDAMAKMLHACWAKSLQQKYSKEDDIMKKMLMLDEELARKLQAEEDFNHSRSRSSSPQKRTAVGSPRVTESPAHRPPVTASLQEIMDEEMAIEASKQQYLDDQARESGQMNVIATQLKRQQLIEMFPTFDASVMEDIFKAHQYNLEATIETIEDSHGPGLSSPKKIRPKPSVPDNQQDSSPHSSSSDAGHTHYEDLRAEASVYYKLRQESYQKAREAYERGMKDVASFYSHQGHLHTEKLRLANKQAALAILTDAKEKYGENVLDLHGLHVGEALSALQSCLARSETELSQGDRRRQYICVITGRGSHSRGGVARIRPAVLQFLKKHKHPFTEPQPGVLRVSVTPR